MRANPKGNFVSFKRKNGYNDRGREKFQQIWSKKKEKSHPENSNHNNWSLIHRKKRRWKFFLLCVDKATHMKLNEIMFLLSHGSVTA